MLIGRGAGGEETPVQFNDGQGGSTPTTPIPVLYPPLCANFTNGTPLMVIEAEEELATAYMTLTDTPPSGQASQLDLTGASILFDLRATAAVTPILNENTARIVGGTGVGEPANVAYDFTDADKALLSAGTYKGAVIVVFPDTQKRAFRELQFQYTSEDS
jgi:hypothetical protein